MFTDVNETVDVAVLFKKNKVIPTQIKWNNRVYKIKKINMVHQTLDGRALIHYFSVSDDSNSFKLAFNSWSLIWTLEQVYHE